MSWRRNTAETLLAPSASSGGLALKLPAARWDPPLDERLVKPETREEMVRGERVIALPANAEHADRHFELDYVVRAHVNPGFVGSTDMLTRLSEGSDFATDTSVRRAGKDPKTGQRYLEELAFEVVNEQAVSAMTVRAEDLTDRGVRRVFAIFVKKGEIREWLADEGDWQTLDPDGVIDDPCLARPLAVRAVLDAAAADDAVVMALKAKGNPAILALEAAAEQRGRTDAERARDEAARARDEALAEVERLKKLLAERGR